MIYNHFIFAIKSHLLAFDKSHSRCQCKIYKVGIYRSFIFRAPGLSSSSLDYPRGNYFRSKTMDSYFRSINFKFSKSGSYKDELEIIKDILE